MMDAIFDYCVRILVFLAGRTGLTYKEINVWIFVILWPIVSLLLVIVILVQHRRIKVLSSLRKASRNNRST
ncbi:MAG: hypothetical protein ABSA10_03440 [Anaerolineales bacterium]|jgi:hypothetical protein